MFGALKLCVKPSCARRSAAACVFNTALYASPCLAQANLDKFLSRDSFRTYELLDPSHQSTAQTSHTLLCTDTEDASSDTVAVEEFCVFVTRYVAEIMDLAIAKNCPSAVPGRVCASGGGLACTFALGCHPLTAPTHA